MEGGRLRHRQLIATIVAFMSLILFVSGLEANDLQLQRWQRWQQQSVSRAVKIERQDVTETTSDISAKSLASAVADIKVNNDGGMASFAQHFSDVVYCPDGKGVAVWEDERNGEWNIYAQLLTVDGLPTGSNVRLIHDASFRSSRQPRLAVNAAGKLALIWNEEESAAIKVMVFNSNLSALTGQVRLNDNIGNSIVNLPAITALSTGGFAVVWEDSRDGANIYGQIIGDGANWIGANFRVNSDANSPYRIAPDVAASNDTTFAVVWEDARSGDGHSYFRIFKNDGTPLYNDLLLEANYPTAYQFSPQVRFITGTGYFAGWISTRNDGQSIYGQVISKTSVPVDTSLRINSQLADICWDLRMAAARDSGVGCVWADYTTTAQIKFQKISNIGKLTGTNVSLQDNSLLGERNFPAVAFRSSGLNVVWTDARSGNPDILQQRLDLALSKEFDNLILNDDQTGSQQYSPDITWLPQSANAIVWRDCQTDAGDIYLQRSNLSGAPIGAALRINDDPGRGLQSSPRIGSSTSGDMVVVWEDSRTAAGVGGQNIFAQRLWANGTKVGGNFVVNDDGTTKPKSQPDIAVGNDGSSVIVWVDQRANRKQIYCQRYNPSGVAIGRNQLVADALGAVESFSPRVGMRSDASFVVSFLSIVGGHQELFIQRFNASGVAVDDLKLLDVDASQVEVLDSDIFVHDSKGAFYIAAIQMSASGSVIKWYRYGFNGNLELGGIQVTDVTGASFSDLRTTGDIDDGIVVSWSDSRSGIQRGYFQLLREDGFHLGNNIPVSTRLSPALEKHPAVALNNGFVFCSWIDNRNVGRGFDVFLNYDQYTATDIGDINVSLPKQFELEQNFPNPFNPQTVIRYELRKAQAVTLVIYNTLGQQVRTVVSDYQTPGSYSVTWDGTSSSGTPFSSGIYFYRLQAGDYSETRKMTLLK
jgi:hypothetical protein